jgi:hypothetical protein
MELLAAGREGERLPDQDPVAEVVQVTAVRATAPEDLAEITDLIHDRWFDLDSVVIDEEAAQIRVPMLDRRPGSGWLRRLLSRTSDSEPVIAGELVVRCVRECSIEDQAGIRWFDFNRVRYDEAARRISIESNVPLEIVATVDDLDVTVTML